MIRDYRINGVGRRTAAALTVTGTAWTKLITTPTGANGRNGVRITNNDPTVVLALIYQDAKLNLVDPPTVAAYPVATSSEDYVAAKQTLTILLGPDIAIYAANDTGAGTTSCVTLREIY